MGQTSNSTTSGGDPGSQRPPRHGQEEEQQAAESRRPKDCLSCRVTGAAVCFAVSAYLTAQHYAQPPTGRIHRAVMLGAAGGFLALGIARALI